MTETPMPPKGTQPDPAKARFAALTLMRFSGAALIMLGLGVQVGKVDLPMVTGPILAFVGMFDMFIMPVILAKRWKTPR
ncbi:MAG: hypothetical protein ABJA20_09135 [Novosphingobium sp.]